MVLEVSQANFGTLFKDTLFNLHQTQQSLGEWLEPNVKQQSINQWIDKNYIPLDRIPDIEKFLRYSLDRINSPDDWPDGQPSPELKQICKQQVFSLIEMMRAMQMAMEHNKRQGIAAIRAFSEAQASAEVLKADLVNMPGVQQLKDELDKYNRQMLETKEKLMALNTRIEESVRFGFLDGGIAYKSGDPRIERDASDRLAIRRDRNALKERTANLKTTMEYARATKDEMHERAKSRMRELILNERHLADLLTTLPDGQFKTHVDINGRRRPISWLTSDRQTAVLIAPVRINPRFFDPRPLTARLAEAVIIQKATNKNVVVLWNIDDFTAHDSDYETILLPVYLDADLLGIKHETVIGDWRELFAAIYKIDTGETPDPTEFDIPIDDDFLG
jgi:hypothetical protein